MTVPMEAGGDLNDEHTREHRKADGDGQQHLVENAGRSCELPHCGLLRPVYDVLMLVSAKIEHPVFAMTQKPYRCPGSMLGAALYGQRVLWAGRPGTDGRPAVAKFRAS